MRFRSIGTEYPNYYREYTNMHIGISPSRNRSEEDKAEFSEKWRSCNASLRDWINAGSEEIKIAERGLSKEQQSVVNQRRKYLYDILLEAKVQDRYARRLKQVVQYAPSAVVTFCEQELDKLRHLAEESKPSHQTIYYLQENLLNYIPDFKNIFVQVIGAAYQSAEDIYVTNGTIEAEALARYKIYLEKILSEGLESELNASVDPDEVSLLSLWPNLLQFAKELTVHYRSSNHHYKEDSFVDYTVISVSGCSEWLLRKRMDHMFDDGYRLLLDKLSGMDKDEQEDIITNLIDEIKSLLDFIDEGEYVKEESEYSPRKEYRFKKFRSLRYQGDDDLRFALNGDSRLFMDQKLVGYVEAWIESVLAMERKTEHLLNNLNLVNRLSVTFDVKGIFENVFIVESVEIARQGTAFYLQEVGIITCDHCLRDENDKLCTDAVFIRLIISVIKFQSRL